MNAKPYPKYKPSGVEWLGDVPEHWDVKGAALGFEIQLGKMLQPEAGDTNDTEVPYLKSQHVQWKRVRVEESPQMWASPRDIKKYGVADGDLLVCEGGDVGRAAIVRQPDDRTIIQNALHRVRSSGTNNVRFLLRVLEHAAAQDWFSILCNRSTIAHFTAEKFGALRVPFPPSEEQEAIADFLDDRTAKLDALLHKKRALIGKLKEKRSALISRTVTKGLPPEAAAQAGLKANPKLKPSGIEWLGDIPEHWRSVPMKYAGKIGNGSTPNRDNSAYWEGEHPWLNSSVVNQETVTSADQFVTDLALRECHLPWIRPPAVLVGITGEGRTRGMATTLLIEATINQHVAFLKPNENRATVAYLRRVMDTAYDLLRSESEGGGSTKGAITCSQLANTDIPLPPLPEQTAIAAYLDRESAMIDRMIQKVETAIEKLTEYRTALITAAVTGKIDVRKAR